VIAKGEDELAFQIREIAKANGVPVVPHPPLTRALYQETEIGEVIPNRYIQTVVSVVGVFFTYEEKQKRLRERQQRQNAKMEA
jgi:flagellar biosynthetic protein FlhB